MTFQLFPRRLSWESITVGCSRHSVEPEQAIKLTGEYRWIDPVSPTRQEATG